MIQASYCEVEKGGVFAHISSVSCCLLLVGDGVGGGSCLEGGILKGLVCMDLQLEKEAQMEALKSSLRSEAVAQRQSHGAAYSEETAWVVVEKGEGFSVDELLNLGEFGNNEQEAEEEDREDVKEAEAAGQMETENNSGVAATAAAAYSSSPSSSGSALSCEAPPPLPLPLSEMSLPAHDAEELEWVSFIIDDSGSEFPAGVAPFHSLPQTQTKSDDSAQRETLHKPHAAAAVAATQGASFPYSTICTFSTEAPVPARAKRSKRSRTVAVGWSSLRFADSSSSTTTTTTTSSAASCSSASSSLSSCLIYDHPVTTNDQSFLLYESHPSLLPPPPPPQSKHQKVPKKRGRKPKPHADAGAARPSGERRCSHCGVQKTPQWRAGPLGAKTLCNACGVRFKSGRLLPEYRPACSPTFQNAIHSNSHRKVLEMRRKKEEFLAAAGPAVAIC